MGYNFDCKVVWYTMFLVFALGAKTYKFFQVPTLEHATWSWTWETQRVFRLIPATLSDCRWALLMDIAKARCIGNWRHLNSNGISVGTMGILDINTSSSFAQPIRIVVSITWGIRLFTVLLEKYIHITNKSSFWVRKRTNASSLWARKKTHIHMLFLMVH
jgi:hypothetical protein